MTVLTAVIIFMIVTLANITATALIYLIKYLIIRHYTNKAEQSYQDVFETLRTMQEQYLAEMGMTEVEDDVKKEDKKYKH